MLRRNNSPAHETIFHLACRRPETLADYHFAQRSAAKAAHGERVMQNVIAINAAARQGIIAAQATSDQMLLERSEEHTSELQSHLNLVCRLLLEKKKKNTLKR